MAYGLLIAWLSLTPGSDSEPLFAHADKVMHFCAYFVFSLLCTPFTYKRLGMLYCVLSVFIFGASMEIGQLFVPMRDASTLDLLANTLGALFGIFFAVKLRSKLWRISGSDRAGRS